MGFFSSIGKGLSSVGSFFKDRGSSIVSGAAAGGSMGGPWGALAGGVLGAVTGKGKTAGMVGGLGNMASGIMSSLNGTQTSGGVSSGADWLGMLKSGIGGLSSMSDMFGGTTDPDTGQPKSAAQMGRDTREYLKNAFPELNPWERSGAGASGVGAEMGGQDIQRAQLNNQVKLQKMQNDTAVKIAGMNNATSLQATAMNNNTSQLNTGLQSHTSRLNTADTVAAQNALVDSRKAEIAANVQRILADTSLTPARQAQLIASAAASGGAANASNASAQNLVQSARAQKMSNDAGNPRYPGKAASELNSTGTLVSDWVDSAYGHVKGFFGGSKTQGVSGSMAPRKVSQGHPGQSPTYAVPGASSSR